MPNLRWIVTLGEPALRWLTGNAQSELASRTERAAVKAWEQKVLTYQRKVNEYEVKRHAAEVALAAWETRKAAPAAGRKPRLPKPPVPPTERPPEPKAEVGWHTVTNWRGSALPWQLGERHFTVFPMLHPAAVLAFRQPRLKPLLTMDFVKATRIARGQLVVPEFHMTTTRTASELEAWFVNIPQGRIGLDIEWSSRLNELQCIAIGQGELYTLIPWRDIREPSVQSALFAVLQREFDNHGREWGGHFVCGYDERKLREVGLTLHCSWDSLYGFHVAFAELGSPRDEENPDLTQASGYDLGFVASVLTPFPYHKGVVSHTIDAADVSNEQLYPYCAKDVRACAWAMDAIAAEFNVRYGASGQPGWTLMRADMERTRRATAMGQRGIPVLEDRRQRAIDWLTIKLDALDESARTVAGSTEFNPHSLHQLGALLKQQGVVLRAKTKTGRDKLDAKVIDHLIEQHPENPLLASIGELRSAQKELAVYVGSKVRKGLTPRADGTVAVSWKVHGTVGPRWSSTPNVQNLTTIEKLVIGRKGWLCVVGDLDAAELRVAAVIANQRDLMEQLDDPDAPSPHLATCMELFRRAHKRNWPDEYRFAKSANYRWLYTLADETINMEGGNLRTNLVQVSPEALARLTHWLNRRWPAIVAWKRRVVDELQATGFSRSPQGRMRDLRWAVRSHDKKSKHHAARAALNFPIQSCVGELVGEAFVDAWRQCEGTPMELFENEHDSLGILCPPNWAGNAKVVLTQALGKPLMDLRGYRIPVSVKVGASWGET